MKMKTFHGEPFWSRAGKRFVRICNQSVFYCRVQKVFAPALSALLGLPVRAYWCGHETARLNLVFQRAGHCLPHFTVLLHSQVQGTFSMANPLSGSKVPLDLSGSIRVALPGSSSRPILWPQLASLSMKSWLAPTTGIDHFSFMTRNVPTQHEDRSPQNAI